MLARYLTFLYLKNFFTILIALVIFFVGLDFLQAVKSLPNSANLQILYIIYKSLFAIDLLLPIATIFAMISSKIYLIRSNALVAIYSVGYGKKDVIKPFFLTSLAITTIFVLLHLTPFSYSNENAKNIKNNSFLKSSTTNLFFKYDNFYIYFKKLYPFSKKAEDIKIFTVDKGKLKKIVSSKEAFFDKDIWVIKSAKEVDYIEGKSIKIEEKNIKDIKLLKGFKPRILDTIYEGKTSFNILDAIYAIKLLKEQNLSIKKVLSVLFSQLIYPFFAPILMIILFYFVPITQRIKNITIFSFSAIVISLMIWGFLFTLVRLALTGVLSAYIAILLPIFILSIIAVFFYKKY